MINTNDGYKDGCWLMMMMMMMNAMVRLNHTTIHICMFFSQWLIHGGVTQYKNQ